MKKCTTKQLSIADVRRGSSSSSDYIREKVASEMAGIYMTFKVRSEGGKLIQATATKAAGKSKKAAR